MVSRCFKISLIIFTTIILFPLAVVGCGGYKTFILSDIVPKTYIATNFSVEYPSQYKGLFVHYASPDWITVVTNSPPGIGITEIPDISLWISAYKPSGDFVQNYQKSLELHLNIAKTNSHENFELIERSELTVDVAYGERVVYYYLRDSIPDVCESALCISYSAYFKQRGFIWLIEVSAVFEKAEQAKDDFEYIINSFKFQE